MSGDVENHYVRVGDGEPVTRRDFSGDKHDRYESYNSIRDSRYESYSDDDSKSVSEAIAKAHDQAIDDDMRPEKLRAHDIKEGEPESRLPWSAGWKKYGEGEEHDRKIGWEGVRNQEGSMRGQFAEKLDFKGAEEFALFCALEEDKWQSMPGMSKAEIAEVESFRKASHDLENAIEQSSLSISKSLNAKSKAASLLEKESDHAEKNLNQVEIDELQDALARVTVLIDIAYSKEVAKIEEQISKLRSQDDDAVDAANAHYKANESKYVEEARREAKKDLQHKYDEHIVTQEEVEEAKKSEDK